MLQDTCQRIDGLHADAPYLICNEVHRFLAAAQLRQQGVDNARILLEPAGRNTAPAIALAAIHATVNGADPLLLVMPADHVVRDVTAFERAIVRAMPLAEAGRLVTFGIVPKRAETGYGYIRRGEAVDNGYWVQQFTEKPDAATASAYVNSGEYYWNSGMFLFRASSYLRELERLSPAIVLACRAAIENAVEDLDFTRVDADAFAGCPSNSIDYAVMEHTEDGVVVPLDVGWSDVGTWATLWETAKRDDYGNVVHGDVIMNDCKNVLIHGSSRLVATLGLEDLVVVETKDAVLIAARDRVQDISQIVKTLEAEGRSEIQAHREVYRPWGVYDSIDTGDRHQVKRITVKPGAKLSVQKHYHRAEHWVVVSGTAKVTNGERSYLVSENESTYIPLGQVHALENPGSIPLELIEVQSGSYLGEDDIVRFEDRYGRC